MNSSLTPRLRPFLSALSRRRDPRSLLSTKAPKPGSSEQVHPRAPFYDALLEYKLPPQRHTGVRRTPAPETPASPPETPAKPTKARRRKTKTETEAATPAPAPAPAQAFATQSSETKSEDTPEARARIIFGSSLAGPARRADLRSKSTLVAGVLVPPKPEEPDHCCMSGCVNCVWDQYREDMEEHLVASAEADKRLREREGDEEEAPESMSIDDDGGGSETNWSVEPQKLATDFWDEELYKGIPVGIREFMKSEKRLKEKHAREGTVG
ncbi:uncharacterized protein DNG_10185 [Cephalotrichum gorgonifer]|uniref:Oxidoreductase-like domain-containing protein n=1 Tax=Cephalotrichum gorgonifer TaxID=2041049 RepID=A0AAE8N755_9PEZI|nr:uncharacterized protein DNG_10185 [Cephalotrichum gorgonifer]